MKPRLRLIAGRWRCRHLGSIGYGDTPAEAFVDMWRIRRISIAQQRERQQLSTVYGNIGQGE